MTPDEIRANVKAVTAPIYETAQLEAQKNPSHENALAVAAIAAAIALATDILVSLNNLVTFTGKIAHPIHTVRAPQIDMIARIDTEDRIRVLLRPFVDVNAPAARQLVNALADMVVRPE